MDMIYIHSLKDLNRKTAEVESVPIIRRLKSSGKLPILESGLSADILQFFVKAEDIELMKNSLGLIKPAVSSIISLQKSGGPLESINLKRACDNLAEIMPNLERNISYLQEMIELQGSLASRAVSLFNKVRMLKTDEEKQAHNSLISSLFGKILRNDDSFSYSSMDIIGEGKLERIRSLSQSMSEGFFFAVELEEHLKKQGFNDLKKRIPQECMDRVSAIQSSIEEIRNGVERAYASNMNLMSMAVVLYSYLKWAMNK